MFFASFSTQALFVGTGSVVTDQVHGPSHEILHYGCVQAIPDLLPFAAAGEEFGVLQYRKVMRHGGLGHVELLGQISRGHFALAEEAENLPASWVGQRLECFIATHEIIRCIFN